jgi:hypothetical protein
MARVVQRVQLRAVHRRRRGRRRGGRGRQRLVKLIDHDVHVAQVRPKRSASLRFCWETALAVLCVLRKIRATLTLGHIWLFPQLEDQCHS